MFMRRIHLFLVLTIISIASLIAVSIVGYYVLSSATPTPQTNWMGQMWQGMGGTMETEHPGQPGTQNTAAPYFGVAFIASVAIAVLGIVGLVYFALFPEIRVRNTLAHTPPTLNISPAAAIPVSASTPEPTASASAYDSVLKTMTADERKVIEVLKKHNGKYLQKYIRSETALSRLQTHRIVARLAERGIVTLEKTGNTNTVLLAAWLK
jgi:uncharacterized membrane protein